jgi:hypothetical protein
MGMEVAMIETFGLYTSAAEGHTGFGIYDQAVEHARDQYSMRERTIDEAIIPWREAYFEPTRVGAGEMPPFICRNVVKNTYLESDTPLNKHEWWEKKNTEEWWETLRCLNSMKCNCGIIHHPLLMAAAYGGEVKASVFRGVISPMPFKDAIKHVSVMMNCCVCRPASYRVLASHGAYIQGLRYRNFTREIFGKKTCHCMGCR